MTNKQFSGSTLKIIALISMLIDHIGSVILINGIAMNAPYSTFSDGQFALLMNVANYCHIIGRLAFPLFCFLLVEGFYHTHNRKNYVFRLGIMAIVAEPIYDLALEGQLIDFSGQNVLFTLCLGLITLIIISKANNQLGIAFITCGLSGLLSYYLKLDGWYYGIILITLFYLFKKQPRMMYPAVFSTMFLCGLDYSLQGLLDPNLWVATFSLVLIAFYNGRRGINLKYGFYLFYPGHLLLLYVLSQWLIPVFW